MKKYRMRLLLYFLILVGIIGMLGFSCYSSWERILNNKREARELEARYNELLSDESDLESNLAKLQDPEYVAQYAREKYLYSKDGEIIIDIADKK